VLWSRHVMHTHLASLPEADSRVSGLAEQASFFLMAVCVRQARSLSCE
jgi:hypothetical protein